MPAPINRLESIWSQSEAQEGIANREPTDWSARAKSMENSFEKFLAEYPKTAILAATAAGIALAWIVKRR